MNAPTTGSGLRRDLGTLAAYSGLVGILVGAGIFRVTSDAWRLTGPSVILGHVLLAPAVWATAMAWAVFLSTPLGHQPGGEYTHISATFGGRRLAFAVAWFKLVAFVGALAYLADALAAYLLDLLGRSAEPGGARLAVALAALLLFFCVHAVGVRWYGRLQVAMCAVLAISLVVLVVPGLGSLHMRYYQPFFSHGLSGFLASLGPLFFAWCGFESLAQAAGEVKDAPRRLPRVFLRGVLVTAVVYVALSVVAFGVLPGEQLGASEAPMAAVAAVYLPGAAAALVSIGAVMAMATSLNASMLVPSRLALFLARDGMLPGWLGHVDPRTGTPLIGLFLTLFCSAALLATGQLSLALNLAVFALVLLYLVHSVALLLLSRLNPELNASVTLKLPRGVRTGSALLSVAVMGVLVAVQVRADLTTLATSSFVERLTGGGLTALELMLFWGLIGFGLCVSSRRRAPTRGA